MVQINKSINNCEIFNGYHERTGASRFENVRNISVTKKYSRNMLKIFISSIPLFVYIIYTYNSGLINGTHEKIKKIN